MKKQLKVDENNPVVMDTYRAVGLAEGFIEGTQEEQIDAWQYLHDTRIAYSLQGWFGRTAQAMLQDGIITP